MIKRLMDILGASMALLLLFPLIVVTALLIYIRMGKPVFFCQTRPGLNGLPFKMLKFRTMSNATDASGQVLNDEQRITRVGSLLRSTSLDELPELWNVLLGQMSLVGPRPLLMEYLDRYSPQQARRHEVKPGITGWAQINGRNAISWDEKFSLDVWYVDNRTFWLDIKILFYTVVKVIRRKDINSTESATMPEFVGNNDYD